MRKFLIVLSVCILISPSCYPIAMDGLKSTGILGANSHTHITVWPHDSTTAGLQNIRIFAISAMATAAAGYVNVIETQTGFDNNYAASIALGTTGKGFITGQERRVRADVRVATQYNTLIAEYPDGINVSENMFIDCGDVEVIVYYKQ